MAVLAACLPLFWYQPFDSRCRTALGPQVTVAKGSSPVLSWQVPGGHSVQWEFIIASGPTLRFAASMGTPDATAAQSADVGAGGKVINGSEGEGKFSLLLDNGGNGAEAIVYYRIRTVAPY